MFARDNITALVLCGMLCCQGVSSADVLVLDSESEWRTWTMPRDLVQVGDTGKLSLVRFSREIDAVRDAHLFSHSTQQRGEVRGGIWEAGSSPASAALLLDGDPSTFWQPDPDDALKQWYVDIDLGRAVLARQIRLRFPDEPGARPLRQFTVYVSTGARIQATEDLFEFELVYHTTRPNSATEVIIPLEYVVADSVLVVDASLDVDLDYENRYRVIQYIGIVVEEQHADAALAEVEVLSVGDNISIGARERGAFSNGIVAAFPENLFDADMNTTNLITSGNLVTGTSVNRAIGWLTAGTWFYVDLGAVFFVDELFLYALRQFEGTSGAHRGSTGRGHRILFSDGTPGIGTSLPVPEALDYTELLTHVDPKAQGLYRIRYLFEPRRIRYLFWNGLTDQEWFETKWAEWMLFSSGHPAQVILSSDFIDLAESRGDDRPRIIRELSWEAELPVGTQLQLRSRSGNTLTEKYTFYDRAGFLTSEETWLSKPKVLRGPIDTSIVVGDDWDEWSNFYQISGEPFKSKSPRRFVQLEMILSTDDPQVAPEVEALSIEFEDALVQRARGSIWPRQTQANVDTRFSYTLLLQTDVLDSGFDLLRFTVPGILSADDVELQVDGISAPPSAVSARGDSLFVTLPEKVVGDSVQISFTARVLQSAAVFALDLGDGQRPNIWQSVEPAAWRSNVVLLPDVPGNNQLIYDLSIEPALFTPNGDGINDQLHISFVLLKLVTVEAQVQILDLAGRVVARLQAVAADERLVFVWSGRNTLGSLVPPGTYLCDIDLGTDQGEGRTVHAIAVAY